MRRKQDKLDASDSNRVGKLLLAHAQWLEKFVKDRLNNNLLILKAK